MAASSAAVDDWQDVGDDWEDVPATSGLESALRGGAQGLSLGFADELAGVAGAVGGALTGEEGDFADRYRQERDESRAAYRAAEEANPSLFRAGEIGGGVAGAFVPGLGVGRGLAGAVRTGAALGGAAGLGGSEADLTRGDVGGALADTAGGAAFGALGGAAGHGLGALAGKVAGRAARGIRSAEADAGEQAAMAAQQRLRVARSSLGGEASAGLNAVAKAEEVVANPAAFRPEQVERAAAWLATPEVAALRQNAAQNVLEAGAGRLSGSLQSARNVFQSAQQAATPQAIEEAAGELLANPIRKQLVPRAATLGHRLLPAALAGGGALIGGPEGAAVGTGLGAIAALTAGRPGIVIRNALRSPGVRKLVWEAVQRAVPSGVLGRFGPLLGRVAATNIDDALALHSALLERDDDYAEKVKRAIESAAASETTPDAGMVTP